MKRYLPFIAIIFTAFGLLHYFIFQTITRSIENPVYILLLKLVLILGLLSIPTALFIGKFKIQNSKWRILSWVGYIWMGSFNIFLFFSLVELMFFVASLHNYSYWVLWASLIITLWSLFKGLSSPKLITRHIHNEKLKGLKLIQISDLHVGMLHLNEVWLAKIVERINRLEPDIVAITGDLVEGEYLEITPKLQSLMQLKSKLGKYYITGNHEYINGSGPWETKLGEMGFTVLHNQNKLINYKDSKILMAGVPDKTVARFLRDKHSLPDLALKNSVNTDYKILLAHQPSSVFDIKNEKCDLILSGHTHGGQIFPFHFLVRLVQPVVAGFKTINGIKVFAHQGTGLWGPPMRWFSRSEIVMIEWV